MRTLAVAAVCLLLGMLAGLTLRPDDGTQVRISPAESGAVVAGVDHGKPLPRLPSAVDLVRAFAALSGVVLTALVIAPPGVSVVRAVHVRQPHRPAAILARAVTRRGPPALV